MNDMSFDIALEREADIRPSGRPPLEDGERKTKSPRNPMQPEILASAPRCGARARTRGGSPCRSPAVRGSRRCRMHGGKGSGAPRGNRNAWKHGAFAARMKDLTRYLRMTAMVVKHANRTIWWEDCLRRAAARDRLTAALRRPPTPIDLGDQPHAPGNSGEMAEAIGSGRT